MADSGVQDGMLRVGGNVVMIDNYDSFTWNVYQFLELAGAKVQVFRNDKITLEELRELKPSRLVVSPGPGHPSTDGGISSDAIAEFAGKIPILGVCMGAQCIFSVFGGSVEFAGEIVHGKTSTIKHDSKGIFCGIPQDIAVTRYHSLAGTRATLPKDVEISSWTESNVIMGVRHKTLTIEGVQFHPESILSEHGQTMIKKFLAVEGGTWKEAGNCISGAKDMASLTSPSILDKIYQQRKADVASQKEIPGFRPQDLLTNYSANIAPPLIDFPARLSQRQPALMAEIKRASPSKGHIDIDANAATQALRYAKAGASVISVLTEPHWFKGSLQDLSIARAAVANMPNRPALLRKEFIFDAYQILEARLAGADTVLLIVKMLTGELLKHLYNYSKSLRMEPLVEVNDAEEMQRALDLGAKVIGVNNRDLRSFKVDLNTTSNLVSMVPKDVTLCALSGISTRKDIEKYEQEGIRGMLVGEALMRAEDTATFISLLFARKPDITTPKPLVKICGTRTAECAKVAVEEGADLVGMIFAFGTKRTVDPEQALEIVRIVRNSRSARHTQSMSAISNDYFDFNAALIHMRAPLTVGVFRDQPLEYILACIQRYTFDIVQLHGSEPLEWARFIPVPVIRRFSPGEPGLACQGFHALPLLDSGTGGTGKKLDWNAVKNILSDGPRCILAGGLDPDNVREAMSHTGAFFVDVSSGIETDGKQDPQKIRQFIRNAKSYKL